MKPPQSRDPASPPRAAETAGSSPDRWSRRTLLRTAGSATVAGLAASGGLGTLLPLTAGAQQPAPINGPRRVAQARAVRFEAANQQALRPLPEHLANGDEQRHPDFIANFTKGLPHDSRGHVLPKAYAALLNAVRTGRPDDFERIPLGGARKLANPQAGWAFELIGADSHHLTLPPAPAFSSAESAGEMVELYWMALARDIPFSEYETHPLTRAAATHLSSLSDFRGPRQAGSVSPRTLFRGTTPGDLVGPYLSQFLLLEVPYGAQLLEQRSRVPVAADDYMTAFAEWLALQNGHAPGKNVFDRTRRYLRTLRDLGEFVHVDFSFQAYLNAQLILQGLRAPAHPSNPYRASRTQQAVVTFGNEYITPLMAAAANRAQKAVYFQKWAIHRRLRPEEYAGRVHRVSTGAADYPLHAEVLNNPALEQVFSRFGSYLLPQAYPEGSPLHPSYGAAHSAAAGACVTILKAFYDGTYVLPAPVVASPEGLSLAAYSGPPLTVEGELNKLAYNCSLGRNGAGVHYRGEAIESMILGESVALEMLRDEKLTFNESFRGFSLTRFDGTPVIL